MSRPQPLDSAERGEGPSMISKVKILLTWLISVVTVESRCTADREES